MCYTGVPSGGREDVCAGCEGVAGVERELACTLASRSGGNLHVTSMTTQIMQYKCVFTHTCLLSTSSTTAIGALSPFRLGILSTRVNPPGRVA